MAKKSIKRDFLRTEKKFLLTKEQRDALVKDVLEFMSADEYCKDGKSYTVRNIYYDTPENAVMYNCSRKPDFKEKVRIRSYDPIESDEQKIFLEIKKKINGVVSKRRVVIPYKDAKAFLNDGVFPKVNDFSSLQTLREIENFCKRYQIVPYAFIRYERQAFFDCENSDIRLTIDSRLAVRTTDVDLKNETADYYIIPGNMYLAEIKFVGAMPMYFAKILSKNNLHFQSFSKCGKLYEKELKNL